MNEQPPLISVVLCTYNGEKYLAAQLDSILAQTYPVIEIVVCDDVSTDGTPAIIKQYSARDSRIRFYENKKNLGYNKNFEKACTLTNSDWIAFADQDDLWLPGKLAALFGCVRTGTLLVHSYNAEFKNDDPSILYANASRLRFKGSNTRQLLFYNTVSGHTMLLHKKLLHIAQPFPPDVYYDWWLGIQASIRSKVELHSEALVLHRQHGANFSHLDKQVSGPGKKAKFFHERIQILTRFSQVSGLSEDDKTFLKTYIALLGSEWQKSFSFRIFFFYLAHCRSAFYYRKKTPMLFYYLKYSWQKASMKVKHWT